MERRNPDSTRTLFADRNERCVDYVHKPRFDIYCSTIDKNDNRASTSGDPLSNDPFIVPICPDCIKMAVLLDYGCKVRWRNYFGHELTEETYKKQIKEAMVVGVSHVPVFGTKEYTDEWVAVFYLNAKAQRKYDIASIQMQVSVASKNYTDTHRLTHSAIVTDMKKWAFCSTCVSMNPVGVDVFQCAATECDNNGMRRFTTNQIKRYRQELMNYEW